MNLGVLLNFMSFRSCPALDKTYLNYYEDRKLGVSGNKKVKGLQDTPLSPTSPR